MAFKTINDVCNILQLFTDEEDEFNFRESLWWNVDKETNEIDFYFDCSDVFLWGCSDAEAIEPEDIEDIRKAMADLKAIREYNGCRLADLLWISRKRKLRPQVAWYNSNFKVQGTDTEQDQRMLKIKELFDACGSEEDQYGTKAFNNKHVEPHRKKNVYEYLDVLCNLESTKYNCYSFHSWVEEIKEFKLLTSINLTYYVPFTKYVTDHMKEKFERGESTWMHIAVLHKVYGEQIKVPENIRGKIKELTKFYYDWVVNKEGL